MLKQKSPKKVNKKVLTKTVVPTAKTKLSLTPKCSGALKVKVPRSPTSVTSVGIAESPNNENATRFPKVNNQEIHPNPRHEFAKVESDEDRGSLESRNTICSVKEGKTTPSVDAQENEYSHQCLEDHVTNNSIKKGATGEAQKASSSSSSDNDHRRTESWSSDTQLSCVSSDKNQDWNEQTYSIELTTKFPRLEDAQEELLMLAPSEWMGRIVKVDVSDSLHTIWCKDVSLLDSMKLKQWINNINLQMSGQDQEEFRLRPFLYCQKCGEERLVHVTNSLNKARIKCGTCHDSVSNHTTIDNRFTKFLSGEHPFVIIREGKRFSSKQMKELNTLVNSSLSLECSPLSSDPVPRNEVTKPSEETLVPFSNDKLMEIGESTEKIREGMSWLTDQQVQTTTKIQEIQCLQEELQDAYQQLKVKEKTLQEEERAKGEEVMMIHVKLAHVLEENSKLKEQVVELTRTVHLMNKKLELVSGLDRRVDRLEDDLLDEESIAAQAKLVIRMRDEVLVAKEDIINKVDSLTVDTIDNAKIVQENKELKTFQESLNKNKKTKNSTQSRKEDLPFTISEDKKADTSTITGGEQNRYVDGVRQNHRKFEKIHNSRPIRRQT